MDQVRVLRVVIASPGDVKPEREIIPRVVDEVNRNIANPRGLHLKLYRWETDSHPGFHPEGPQGLIDPILKIEDCDILIGIFWRRFGTPVSDAKSGTEHEFRLAYEAWKKNKKPQIMVYFSQKPYTPKSKEETDQWGLVLQFKREFPSEGLWIDYKNRAEFEQFTRNHLTHFLSSQFPIDKPTPEPPTSDVRSERPKDARENNAGDRVVARAHPEKAPEQISHEERMEQAPKELGSRAFRLGFRSNLQALAILVSTVWAILILAAILYWAFGPAPSSKQSAETPKPDLSPVTWRLYLVNQGQVNGSKDVMFTIFQVEPSRKVATPMKLEFDFTNEILGEPSISVQTDGVQPGGEQHPVTWSVLDHSGKKLILKISDPPLDPLGPSRLYMTVMAKSPADIQKVACLECPSQ